MDLLSNSDQYENSFSLMDKKQIPPKLAWVHEYIRDMGFPIDADEFFDYHESRGWLVGKVKMKDWQAAVRTFVRNELKWREKNENSKSNHKRKQESNHARVCATLQRQIANGG